jgi:hypothetical protein
MLKKSPSKENRGKGGSMLRKSKLTRARKIPS